MTGRLIGLIPAAGKGVRARPYTTEVHKGMLSVGGRPNLETIITIMRDDLSIRDITIVTGHLGETIRAYFGDGSQFGVRLRYVENRHLERGLAWSVLLGMENARDHCCVMLCDEHYVGANHNELARFPYRDYSAVCGGMMVDDRALIHKNYAIYRDGTRIERLVEKPSVIDNDIMGSGTFILSPEITGLLHDAFERTGYTYVEFVSFLNELCPSGKLGFFEITGTYVNINDRDSLNLARYHNRERHFSEYRVSLIVYAVGDEEDIAFTLTRYQEVPELDQIYVVLPAGNTIQARAEAVPGVRIITCPQGCSGFGERVRFALERAAGDILILTEADYSFPNRDVHKLLSYLPEADMVLGTRTTRQLIEQGSDMQGLARAANATLGRLLEFLWWNREARFTDVGCTFRAFWRSAYDDIVQRLRANGPEFLAEMVIESLNDRMRVIEIPVNYFNRSTSLRRIYRNKETFFRFLGLILSRRRASLLRKSPRGAPSGALPGQPSSDSGSRA